MRLDKKAAIITGAAGGIGGAIARAFAREGADLCLVDLAWPSSKNPAAALGDELCGPTRCIVQHAADVSDVAQARHMVTMALEALGRIDILVNVAGVTSKGRAADLSEMEWDRVMTVNLKGVFFCCQAVIGPMRARGQGRIINIGSVNAKSGGAARPWLDPGEQDLTANIAYSVSKAGVHTMTFCLARELARDGITVNAVAPGTIASDMTATFPQRLCDLIPVGRIGRAEEVAEAVVFLASDTTGFITGEVLDINGGVVTD